MNISSRATDPLLAALTNPTELARRKGNLARPYPVIDTTGRHWPDAEAAYKTYKTGDTPHDVSVMTRIMTTELRQHPELVRSVDERGGVAFLERCTQLKATEPSGPSLVGVRNSRWEGVGRESRFIRCLIAAYKGVR